MDVEMTVREVDFAAEPAGFAIITDISERRRAEQKLEFWECVRELTIFDVSDKSPE